MSQLKVNIDLNLPLRPYQVEGVNKFVDFPHALFVDEMGVGKTISCIALDLVRREQHGLDEPEGGWKTLVVCPLTGVVDQWVAEIKRFSDLTVRRINPKKRELLFFEDADVYVIHHDALRIMEMALVDKLPQGKWLHMIIDEAHKIKNRKAKVSKAAVKVGKHFAHRTGATGTPMENRPDELWHLLHWCFPDKQAREAVDMKLWFQKVLNSFWRYYNRYCTPVESPVWMADMSFKTIGGINIGDRVVGWNRQDNGRRKLCESEVLDIRRREASVYTITMESGRVIRCTKDHKWLSASRNNATEYINAVLTDKYGDNHSFEGSNTKGRWGARSLVHVVDPTPELSSIENVKAAAYLSGIYDGEGFDNRISQSVSHNPEIYKRISLALDQLGFDYAQDSDGFYVNGGGTRNSVGEWTDKASEVDLRQARVDFINWLNPSKPEPLKKRILSTRWRDKDTVVSWELDGIEEVVSMKTTTGNYVVWGYASKNCDYYEDEFGYHHITGPRHTEELRELRDPMWVRRLKSEVLSDLPPKQYQQYLVDLTPKQRKAYNSMKDNLIAWIGENENQPVVSPVAISQLVRLQQFALAYGELKTVTIKKRDGSQEEVTKVRLHEPSSKLDALVDILEDLGDTQCVIYSTSKQIINMAQIRLEDNLSLTTGLITGDVPDIKRSATIKRFQAGETQVILATIRAGGVGLNLQNCNTVIFLDRDWSPGANQQAEDRVHRSGQEADSVHIIDIVAKDTIDQRKDRKLKRKWEWIKEVVGA